VHFSTVESVLEQELFLLTKRQKQNEPVLFLGILQSRQI